MAPAGAILMDCKNVALGTMAPAGAVLMDDDKQ